MSEVELNEAEMPEVELSYALNEIVGKMVELYEEKIYSIILYGSYARGDFDAESDVDIALIVYAPLERDRKKKAISFVSDMDMKYDMEFSLIDLDKSTYDKWVEVLPFYKNIRDEGKLLWMRQN